MISVDTKRYYAKVLFSCFYALKAEPSLAQGNALGNAITMLTALTGRHEKEAKYDEMEFENANVLLHKYKFVSFRAEKFVRANFEVEKSCRFIS